MSGFQPGLDSTSVVTTIDQGFSIWFAIEILVIVAVIIYQFYISGRIYKNIRELKDIFLNRLSVISGYIDRSNLDKKDKTTDDIRFIDPAKLNGAADLFSDRNIVKISITKTYGGGTIKRIRDAINLYLLNNYGAPVNFSIIRDIIDREVDIKDEEISNSLPTPLYFGLAATMIGIIFGLFAMPESNGQGFREGIDALINGVKLAMFGSLTGLACTTVLSSVFYKNARKKISSDKNEQFSYLQATLLPELVKAEDTGVSGLKASLDKFARVATDISVNVLAATKKTGENIVLQREIIDKVANLDVLKISETNLELFNRLENNMLAFNKFSEYVGLMSQISENLKDFASRTRNIDMVIRQIDFSLHENTRLTQFLSTYFDKIETIGLASLKAVDLSDAHFREAIGKLREETESTLNQAFRIVNESASHFSGALEKLKEEVDSRISRLNRDATDSETKLTAIYNDIGAKLTAVTSEHISQFQAAYSNALPRFDQLNNLQLLPGIRDQISESLLQFRNDSNVNTARLIEAMNQLNTILTGVKESINNLQVSRKPTGRGTKRLKTGFFKRLRNQLPLFRRKSYTDRP